MTTPRAILLAALVIAATYASVNLYEVRTDERSLWRINRLTGSVAYCLPRRCFFGQEWTDVSTGEATSGGAQRRLTTEEVFGGPAASDDSGPGRD